MTSFGRRNRPLVSTWGSTHALEKELQRTSGLQVSWRLRELNQELKVSALCPRKVSATQVKASSCNNGYKLSSLWEKQSETIGPTEEKLRTGPVCPKEGRCGAGSHWAASHWQYLVKQRRRKQRHISVVEGPWAISVERRLNYLWWCSRQLGGINFKKLVVAQGFGLDKPIH